MIPDRIFEILHGPAFFHVGTRNAALEPAHAFATGAVPHPDRRTITIFIGPSGAARMLANLADNRRIAFEFGLISHEAYQVKGTFLSSRPADESEISRIEENRQKLFEITCRGYPEPMARRFILDAVLRPCTAVTFEAEEVFLQTPGPGAGTRLA